MKPRVFGGVLLLATLLGSTPTEAHRPRPPLRIGFDAPRMGAIQYDSGWRLSILMTPRDPLGFSIVSSGSDPFPVLGSKAALLFQDLDGCPTLINPQCPVIPGDEIAFGFTPDDDAPFILDVAGDAALRTQLTSAASRPRFTYDGQAFILGPGIQPPPVTLPGGPPLGVEDGIGYGPNDDMPGLVLLSDTGVGQVFTSTLGAPGAVTGFNPLPVRRARNLAGLMTDVSFDVRRATDRTVVSTSLLVPPNLFTPHVVADVCVTTEPFCVIGPATGEQRVDGGPRLPFVRESTDTFDFATSGRPNLVDIELRAIVVQGTAPTFVDDCNGDGRVTGRDLVCAGYTVLSNEAVRSVRVGGLFLDCTGSGGSTTFSGPSQSAIDVDFDQSQIVGGIFCPTGSGRVTRPPN